MSIEKLQCFRKGKTLIKIESSREDVLALFHPKYSMFNISKLMQSNLGLFLKITEAYVASGYMTMSLWSHSVDQGKALEVRVWLGMWD